MRKYKEETKQNESEGSELTKDILSLSVMCIIYTMHAMRTMCSLYNHSGQALSIYS